MKKEQFARAKASPDRGVLIHLICNEADAVFYSDDPDALSTAQCTVLCVETFFSAVCDGGFAAWFDLDHGQLACCALESLRRIGLPHYAELAEQAVRLHHQGDPLPSNVAGWWEYLERARGLHAEEDSAEKYEALETEFFAMYQDNPGEFRERLFAYVLEHEQEFLSEPALAMAGESAES